MKPLNDKMIADLINNAQMGKDAFEQILRYYQHDIFRIIRVYTQNDSDAEDLAQETWVKVYRSIGKLKPPYHFESWLKKVAVNTRLGNSIQSLFKTHKVQFQKYFILNVITALNRPDSVY